jgi:sn-glycerol 3-phosphate transport system substrate-binding protein
LFGLGAALVSSLGACSREDATARGRQTATLWFSYGGRNREVLEALVRRFNETQNDVFVRAVYQGDYYEGLAKLRTAIAARVPPALSHVVGEVVPYLAEAGVLEPLGDYPGARELDVIPALGQDKTWLGGGERPLVCLPFNRSTPIAYLNADVFAAANLSAPRSWSELFDVAQRLTLREGGRTPRFGFGCPISWWFWVALLGQAGGELVDARGLPTLGGTAGVRALELWQRLVGEGVMKPPAGRDYNAWEQTNQDFLAGRTAMIWTSTAFLRYLEDNASFRVQAAPLPGDVRRAVPTGGTHWIIPRSAPSEEKRAAWAFLRFMHEPAQVIEWATRTGYMPTTESAVARLEHEGYYKKHPNDRVAVEQLGVALPWPWSPELFRLEREVVQPRLEAAVLGRENAETVLSEARRLARRDAERTASARSNQPSSPGAR